MALTKEELSELASLEADDKIAVEAANDAAARQHIAALKLRKKLTAKHGVHGMDFVVLETTAGVNIAVRRPLDVEMDTVSDASEDRGAQEKFVAAITLEPSAEEMGKLFAQWPGLLGAVIPKAVGLIGRLREEEVKK